MKLNRDLNCFFQCSYQLGSSIRKQKTCHILDTDGICTHALDLFCCLCPVIQCVGISQRVGQCNLCMTFFLVCCLNCCFKVSQIIQTVKNTDDINTICNGFLYEIFYHIICIRTVTQDVLSAEQHLQLCIFETITEFTKSLPRILFQET